MLYIGDMPEPTLYIYQFKTLLKIPSSNFGPFFQEQVCVWMAALFLNLKFKILKNK